MSRMPVTPLDSATTADIASHPPADGAARRAWVVAAFGLAGLAFLALPFLGLVISTPWGQLQLQQGDLGALRVSVGYTVLAVTLVMGFGTPVAWWLARSSFRGKWVVELLVLLPLLTPPLAMGLLLTMSYGPYSWLGQPLGKLGLSLTNTPAAFLLAQIYGSAPYYIVAARSAFEGVPRDLEQISLTLGSSPWRTFWRITLPLSSLGLGAGVALAWVRALGEFGIVLIIAYYPQGLPVKLWVNLQDTGLSAVYPLLWLFFLIGLPLPLLMGALSRRPHTRA
ncbi:putative ABC-type transport system, permease component [Thiomonas delicata]|jgi:molybdate/tungstate transport system permease protein|uniref:Putative ABC-type transport system, permease component n=2 Tax=Burkholderiales genera incertae sedis TaxID=224471 RepID=A0A238D289_THIDL|nr:putative ABC-type transport system, permease component [Thiomonas delicata]